LNQALRGTLIAGPAGGALFASLYMDWFGSASGWDALGWLETAVIAGAALLTVAFAVAIWAGLSVSLPVAASATTGTVAVIALVFVLHRLLNSPIEGAAREPGLYVALAACLAMLLGAYVGMREERVPTAPSAA
jgi:hypothetical protein